MPNKGSRKAFCYMGHPKSGRNLRIRATKGGRYIAWGCRTCERAYASRRKRKAKAAPPVQMTSPPFCFRCEVLR